MNIDPAPSFLVFITLVVGYIVWLVYEDWKWKRDKP